MEPTELTANIEDIGQEIRDYFDSADQARETLLALARQVIRNSAETIRTIHRGEYERADKRLAETQETVERMNRLLTADPDANTGFIIDALKEHAEAVLTLALIRGDRLPLPSELPLSPAAYVNGLAEAIGEGRRHILDSIRRGIYDDCERLLDQMDEIYQLLVTLDYPDAVTKGLRKRTDAARGILERTRGDLTTAQQQHTLRVALTEVQQRLDSTARRT